ncbi:acetylserotonin O-methyltransferase-like [Salvia hispanica]|uniref:acetylserotonin O-methyltransferase-like n=1 Tax=Salvia hispanica TaxID=49212 RepID=UPI0020098660|nr:acetylserotonin O-methyltransferase-like [Salvia hispanica]XP_047973194.1 acetylserotonin O-methyltransferase-like [Salvia hispanica]
MPPHRHGLHVYAHGVLKYSPFPFIFLNKTTPKPKMAELKASIAADAKLEMWSYALGFTPMALVKCAIDLQIADVIDSHGGSMTLPALSAALACSPPVLRRIMRYLVHRRIFSHTASSYSQTPLSHLLMRGAADSMAAVVLLESTPTMLAPWQRLSLRARQADGSPFEDEHGRDIWSFANANPEHSKLIDDAMSCIAIASADAVADQYPEAFDGISSLVDVGGGDGTALRILVKAFPWIQGISFDLPHVASAAPPCDGVKHVAGDMFQAVPNADAAFLMSVLHDWNDEECIAILRKCKEAIKEKVMIVEAVIGEEEEEEEEEEDKYSDVRLALDMVMLAHTSGKERTLKEWEFVVKEAGFSRFTVKHIKAIPAVIEAYP